MTNLELADMLDRAAANYHNSDFWLIQVIREVSAELRCAVEPKAEYSPETAEGMVAYYMRRHTPAPCPHCNERVTPDSGFACVDCERVYHRDCLRKHCAGQLEEAKQQLSAYQNQPMETK